MDLVNSILENPELFEGWSWWNVCITLCLLMLIYRGPDYYRAHSERVNNDKKHLRALKSLTAVIDKRRMKEERRAAQKMLKDSGK